MPVKLGKLEIYFGKHEFVEYLYYRITDYKTDELQGRRFEKI